MCRSEGLSWLINKEGTMLSDVVNTDSQQSASMGISVAIFLGGVTVGAIAALLLAPQAGRDSRKQLGDYGRRTGQTMSQWATAASDLFASREKVQEAKQEGSGKQRERDEMVKPRPQAVAH
jgi:gas vesicle protein